MNYISHSCKTGGPVLQLCGWDFSIGCQVRVSGLDLANYKGFYPCLLYDKQPFDLLMGEDCPFRDFFSLTCDQHLLFLPAAQHLAPSGSRIIFFGRILQAKHQPPVVQHQRPTWALISSWKVLPQKEGLTTLRSTGTFLSSKT